jgi:hypothetical protein
VLSIFSIISFVSIINDKYNIYKNMPNSIIYNVSTQSLALKKGNFYIGTGDVGKGPTSSTGYFDGVSPASGGYVIYVRNSAGKNLIYGAPNDSQLILITNRIAGTSYTTVSECLVYFAGQTDKMVLNRNYESIVTNGLVLNLDAGFVPSYPMTGSTWYDLSDNDNDGTLTNGPTFNSANGGSIVFDGTNDNVQRNALNVGNNFTLGVWGKTNSAKRSTLIANSYNYNGAASTEGFLFNIGNNGTDIFLSLGRDLQYRVSQTGIVSANTWFYACATYDGTTIKLYFNGIETSYPIQGGSPFTLTYNSQPFYLGYWVNNGSVFSGDLFAGNIGITQVYGHALSASEILQNYNAQKGRFGL